MRLDARRSTHKISLVDLYSGHKIRTLHPLEGNSKGHKTNTHLIVMHIQWIWNSKI